MKKYLIVLSAFSILAISANAQISGNPANDSTSHHAWHRDHDRSYSAMNRFHYDGMMGNVNLSEEQKQQLKEINTTYRNNLSDLEKHDEITVKEYRLRKAALERERKSQFENILTQEQKDQMAEARKKMADRRQMMQQKRLDRMKTDLNLTDEQVSKIQEQQKESMKKAKAIRENNSLTDEQKREEFRNLMMADHNSMKSILTADQLKKQEELRNSRMHRMHRGWKHATS
jgi:periplasmic protein CpxP/Spy